MHVTESVWRMFWRRGLVTTSVSMIVMSCQGKVWHFPPRNNLKKIYLKVSIKYCIISILVCCSCSRGSVRLHRAEPDSRIGPHHSGSWSGVWSTERHPRSTRGAGDKLDSHQNWDNRSSKVRFITGGFTATWRGWTLCHLGGLKLHAVLLLLLEAATLSSTSPSACTTNKPFTKQIYHLIVRCPAMSEHIYIFSMTLIKRHTHLISGKDVVMMIHQQPLL